MSAGQFNPKRSVEEIASGYYVFNLAEQPQGEAAEQMNRIFEKAFTGPLAKEIRFDAPLKCKTEDPPPEGLRSP